MKLKQLKKHYFILVVVLVAGILLALQIRSFKEVEALVERTDAKTVLSQLRIFQLANEELSSQLGEEEKVLADLQSRVANESIESELDRMRLLAGKNVVYGPGIEITFDQSIDSFWITDLLGQLSAVGAESIAFNDVRLTHVTAGFRKVGTGIVMRKTFLRPPYRITAIGPTKELREAIAQHGGIIERIEKAYTGIKILVTERERISIPPIPEPQ
ncbi:hypothetical protein CO046_04320 [Candidatus Peregrinibacteria bacterium CG_4_9_14_0_2_um_filter_53_11]|nr:MAG: hypothetical protein CO046_04320 [Candidatus Peregrinibacteria bacterium CG_4_9_14_0_2_um_filter_53_11]